MIENKEKWDEFQTLMRFLDHMRDRGAWFCRRTTEIERKQSSEYNFFTDLRFDDVEKMVRRYLGLPSKDQVVKELDKMLADIREKHKEEEIREALPKAV